VLEAPLKLKLPLPSWLAVPIEEIFDALAPAPN
jgi:hypothetical protein